MQIYMPSLSEQVLRGGTSVQRLVYYIDINEYEDTEKEAINNFK